ncbi:MAG: peptidoglycan-associated lipoprotein Pal, partial [SAR324 cluster bacterium]|nr:peptidoglycan-associated lipoprotein Pal [SAR324 cluster bacterium]
AGQTTIVATYTVGDNSYTGTARLTVELSEEEAKAAEEEIRAAEEEAKAVEEEAKAEEEEAKAAEEEAKAAEEAKVVEEPEEMRAEEYPPVEEVEFDIEPIFDLLGQVVAPQDYREGLAAAPDKNVIYDKARELERELTMVSAAPQPASMGSALFKVVFFEFDRSNIKPEFRAAIEENAAALKANPNYSVIIEGHCDERGTTEYNLALGNRRATVVYDALIQMGVDPNQLETVSYGEERPAEFGHDEASWQKNRRSVISFR